MAKLKLRTTILSKLSTLTRNEGNLVITRDGESLYFDTDSKRFKISDFIDVADDNDRLAILAPNTEKMYYVLSTNAVWRYISGLWHEVTSTEDISDILTAISGKADSNKAYLTDDSNGTDVVDDDYIPFYDTSASAKKKSTFSNFVAKIKAKLITDTYSGTSTSGMSGKAVKSAIDALDGNLNNTTPSASKTLTAFSQTDGKVSAKFENISISKSQAGLGNVDNTSDATKKTNFTGSIASGNTGFVKGGDIYTALQGKADTGDIPTALSDLTDDSTHRVVTDTQISTWNNKSGSDENVKQTDITDTSWRCLTIASDNTKTEDIAGVRKTVGLSMQVNKVGTASQAGAIVLAIGNSIATGNADNYRGFLDIYNNGKRSRIYSNTTDNRNMVIPDKAGTFALTTDIKTKTSELTNDSNFVSDANYVHTDVNFTSAYETKLNGIATGATKNTAASATPQKVSTTGAVGTGTNYARDNHVHGIDLATGDANGQVKIAGTNVDVKGLGSNAYTSTPYLPLAGGRLTGNLYNKSALGNVDATANDNGISNTAYSGTIEGQDKNNRRITRLETSAYANGDICFGMNIRQWYMNGSTATIKATKGFKLTMNKAGTLSALLDGDSNADWFVGKNGLVVGNINSNYAQLTLDSGVSGEVFLTTPSSNGKLAITSDLGSYNKQVGTCNLMRYPSQHTSKSQNGLIFLDNGDGSVTVTGTATAKTTYYFAVRGNNIWQVILSAGTYMLIGCPSGGSSSTYSIYCNTYIDGTTTESSGVRDTGSGATVTYDYDVSMGCYIDIKKNTAFPTNGVVFRPQIIPFGVYNFDDYIIGAPYAQTNRQLTITKADYSQIATYENTQNASRAYAKNELMIWRGALYRVTTAISSGNTISTSNVTSTTLSAEIKAIRDALNI